MNTLMENGVQLTLEQWMPQIFQKLTVGVSEHPAKISPSPESEKDSGETDQVLLEKYSEFLPKRGKKINLNGLSMKMLRECYQATEDLISLGYSLNLIGGGTTLNGNYSTLNVTEYLKTESEYTLSDILEAKVPEKYFLSEEQIAKLIFQ